MSQIYEPGQVVTLRSSQGNIDRIVVRDLGAVVLICRPDEYERARIERRDPASIGFKKSDIVK